MTPAPLPTGGRSRGHRADGTSREVVPKGGRMGGPDLLVRIRDGLTNQGGVAAA